MQKRWMSSNEENPGKKKPTSKEGAKGAEKQETEKVAAKAGTDEPGRLSSIIHSVGPTLRKVTEWNVGDLVSVYAIVLLVLIIIFSPYVVAQMKKAKSEYIELDEYDPVAQMEKIVRYDLFGEEELKKEYETEVQHHDPARKSIDNTIGMAADVLQSEALQEAIASLITRVLESVQFQNACQQLLKNLWNDLVNDPETTAQVVALLNNAIQNKEIQRSTRRLVLQLIKDKEVYDELTRLLVRLGQEEEVSVMKRQKYTHV
jgi:Ca2+/H+ antiporter